MSEPSGLTGFSQPLSNIFSSTPKNGPNPFAIPNHSRANSPRVKIAADPLPSPSKALAPTSPLKTTVFPGPVLSKPKPVSMADSGYHGSQSQDMMDIDEAADLDETTRSFSRQGSIDADHEALQVPSSPKELRSSTRLSPDVDREMDAGDLSPQSFAADAEADASPIKKPAHHESTTPKGSPTLPTFVDVEESPVPADTPERTHTPSDDPPEADPDAMETAMGSPSEGSSPIRPIVRKSSLNFASLPAREPITHKSIGNRISRTSHLDQNRTSYYRHTGGKSLGHGQQDLTDEENDEMDIDDYSAPANPQLEVQAENAAVHSKTYTQRLQDQINKLGKPQTSGQQNVKAVTDSTTLQVSPVTNTLPQPTPSRQFLSPKKAAMTPGAFLEDDDWIEPLGTPDDASNFKSPRPGLPKSFTTDVMEGVSGKATVGEQDFVAPPAHPHTVHGKSPQRSPAPERVAGAFGHQKSASVPVFPMLGQDHDEENDLKKVTSLATVSEDEQPTTPKSPSHRFNNSPLKQVKNKLSSILKSSRGLLASSAAISAEGKSSLLSPSTTRLGLHHASSAETVRSQSPKEPQPLYPDLSRQVTDTQNATNVASPERVEGRRTRASIEREKAEEKRKREEVKESKRVAEQVEKLEKAREKEREKTRVLGKEQERIAAMEKQVSDQRDQEKRSALATPGNPSKSAKSSPRKPKQQIPSDDQDVDALGTDGEDAEVEMVDAPNPMPPPSISRPVAPSSAMKTREIKRPVKPTKEPLTKAKQAPTVIRVNMGSQHSQYHPSNSTLSSNLHDTLSQPPPKLKGSQPSLQAKRSLQSLKSSTSSSGRPKALEAAARRKEQEEREAQRRRDAKAELDRKRVAMQEEERRQEQQRKLELERQKEEERKQALAQAEAKKNAQRQAMIEKAKQTRAPPPAVRSQPNGPPDYNKSETGPARPPSRLGSIAPRSQEDASRPVNAVLSNASKSQMKRPLPQETGDDNTSRPGQARNANGLQAKDSKRMRMTDELNDPVENEKQPSLKGAPVRPSGGFKKVIYSFYENIMMHWKADTIVRTYLPSPYSLLAILTRLHRA